jgi:lauroyl/myristoyl acyltransferase
MSGFDVLRQAVDSGSGVLLVSGHLGSMGLFFCVTGKSGIQMSIVGRSIDPEENPLPIRVRRFHQTRVRWIEEAVGNPFLLTGRGNYSRMLEKLHAGEVVMLLVDVVPSLVKPSLVKRTVPVTFFGAQAYFADGIASLFRESDARLIQWMIEWRRETRTHHIEFTDITDSVSRSESNSRILQSLVNRLEGIIRSHPDHWLSWDSLNHFYKAGPVSTQRG